MADILIIKCNQYFSPSDMNKWNEYLRNSKETGLILLPYFMDALVVSDDVEVRPLDINGKEKEND